MNSSSCGEVIFSDKDHLEWNQKKHNIMLNLGLTNNHSETDQTPTPTRFIRNCEEVGLFQDLQNINSVVNPFDEVFKNAVENPTSVSLMVPINSSDDTLHTPQIYPPLEDNSAFSSTTAIQQSNEHTLNSVIPNIKQEADDGDNSLVIVLDPESDDKALKDNEKNNNRTEIKIAYKETCRNQTKQKVISSILQKASGRITPVPLEKLIDQKRHKERETNPVERLREANRAAQNRCRKRKQREFEAMTIEVQRLRKENSKLTGINLYLQETVKKLEAELKASKSSSTFMEVNISASIASSETPSTVDTVSAKKSQVEPVNINNQIGVTSPETNKLPIIAPNIKTVVLPVQGALAIPVQNIQDVLPVQNVQNSLNNRVLVVYPGQLRRSTAETPNPILPKPDLTKFKR